MKIPIALTIIILCAGGYWWYSVKKSPATQSSFETTTLQERSLEQYIKATGTLRAREQLIVGSLISGKVIKLCADNNDCVTRGQVLAILDNGTGQAAVDQARARVAERKAQLEKAHITYQRNKILHTNGHLADEDFEKLQTAYDIAQAQYDGSCAELAIQKQTYENCFIRAPEDGTVIARSVDLGQMVTSQLQATQLFIIAKDLCHLEAWIDVDEADIGLVKDGQDAYFVVDAFPEREYQAKVAKVQYLSKVTGNVVSYSVILEVANDDLSLRPNMTTNVEIVVAKKSNALCIPQKALRIVTKTIETVATNLGYTIEPLEKTSHRIRQHSLWTLHNKKLAQQSINLGISNGEFAEINTTLAPDTVIITGVVDGSKTNPLLAGRFNGANR